MVKKSTVSCAVDQNGPSRKTVGYGTARYATVRCGTVRTRSADKFGLPSVQVQLIFRFMFFDLIVNVLDHSFLAICDRYLTAKTAGNDWFKHFAFYLTKET
jgi:hypothetical protein